MRWVSYRSPAGGGARLGVVREDRVHGLPAGVALLDLLGDDGSELAAQGAAALSAPTEVHALGEVELLAPLPVPPSIRDFMAFEDHIVPILRARGGVLDPSWYEMPVFYFTNPAAVHGPSEPVRTPPGGVEIDYELEVAAVIGRAGSDLDPAEAEGHIAGYLLLCDWSARDLQGLERPIGLGPTKGKDWATTFGPFLVTPDEFAGRERGKAFSLRLRASVNGRPYSDGDLSELYWSFGEMIAYRVTGTTVRPGDVLGSGTVGTGCIADLAARHGADAYPWLAPGDRVRLDGGELGAIDVRLVAGPERKPLDDGRPRPVRR